MSTAALTVMATLMQDTIEAVEAQESAQAG